MNIRGDVVGSYQQDAFQGHWHPQSAGAVAGNQFNSGGRYADGNETTSNTGLFAKDPTADEINGTPRTSSETRPKNAYVNYIIKY